MRPGGSSLHGSRLMRWLVALTASGAVLVSLLLVGQRHAALAVNLHVCNGNYVPLPTTDARRVGNEVVGLTALGTWGTTPCSLHDHLMFAVQPSSDRFSSQGMIRSIKGNPATRTLNLTLRPGGVLVFSWRWRNWCGNHGRFTMQAFWRALGYTTPSQTVKPPSCVDPGSHSTLSATRPSIRACSASAYRATTDLGQPFETHLIDFVNLTLRKRRLPCLLRQVHVNFAVEGESGTKWAALREIQGNPGSRAVGTMLTQTYGAFSVFWAWSNWCGGGHRFRAFAKLGSRSIAGPTSTQGATCEESKTPSTLTPSFGHQ